MKKSITIRAIFTAVFAMAGTLFLVISYREGFKKYTLFKKGIETDGVVIDTFRKPTRTGEPRSLATAPLVQFLTDNNQLQLYYSTVFTTPAAYQKGQHVRIWYLPDDPANATLSGKDAWILSAAFAIFGGVICLITYSILLNMLFRYLRQLFRRK
jgi:Protein of unknown function (DUF3592)